MYIIKVIRKLKWRPRGGCRINIRSTSKGDRRWLDDCTRKSAQSSRVESMSRCVQRSTGLATQTNISVVHTPRFRLIDLGRTVSIRLCSQITEDYYCSISLSKRCILNHEPPVGAEQTHMSKHRHAIQPRKYIVDIFQGPASK
jgi:hypothetical protein